uniref:Uncharacterized protein n=1 Tax=Arundo donax TaxID=35708 RepID=A0A0A8YQQ1_ARUDO
MKHAHYQGRLASYIQEISCVHSKVFNSGLSYLAAASSRCYKKL